MSAPAMLPRTAQQGRAELECTFCGGVWYREGTSPDGGRHRTTSLCPACTSGTAVFCVET